MKKRLIRIITWIILIALVLLGFFAYKQMNDYTNIIKLNRWINIPKEAEYQEIYEKHTWPSSHWDGIRYHAYSYKNEEIIDSITNWKENSWKTIFFNSNTYTKTVIARLNVISMTPDDIFLSDFDNLEYRYEKQEDNSEIIIIKDKNNKKLHIFESFL